MSPADGLARARRALLGCAVGDAFGETFFRRLDELVRPLIAQRVLQEGDWPVTDDSMLSLAVFEQLAERGDIDPDDLARRMQWHYQADPGRGYGGGMHDLFGRGAVGAGDAAALFGGTGSYGNGGAMRVAVAGAYFADDPAALVDQAARSARATHTHPEGVAGAVAFAAATGALVQGARGANVIAAARGPVEHGPVADGLEAAAALYPRGVSAGKAAATLGNGARVSAADTVPLCVYILATAGDAPFDEVLWRTVACLGDRDTTCAMVGAGLAAAGWSVTPAWIPRVEMPEPLRRALAPLVDEAAA